MSHRKLASPVPLLEHLGALSAAFFGIHSVWLDTADVDAYVRNNVSVNYNPESNMYLASGVAPITEYLRRGLNVALGTDGTASNDRIEMLAAMRAGVAP